MANTGMTPAQLDNAYRFSGFDQRGEQGQGETIGLIEYALGDPAGVAQYEACTGASLTVDYVPTVAPPGATSSEVGADIEVVAALAPKATVVVYENSQQGTGLEPWDLAVSGTAAGGLPQVITSSWGSCEPDTGMTSAYYHAEEALFEEAAAQGQTIFVASGDDGSEGCFDQNGSKELAIDDPASAPYVTAVGGTSSDTPAGPEYVWNSRNAAKQACLGTGCTGNGASGGGASILWPRPSYQPVALAQPPDCTLAAEGCREIPDVSALAGDPYALYCSQSVCQGGGWISFGGTSLAAPSWGAAVLLSESSCPSPIGFLNPLLYGEPTVLTGAITSGNNDLTGTHPGLYQASTSGAYSMAGGLGYLGGANLSSGALCGSHGATGTSGGSASSGGSGSTGSSTTPTTSTTLPGSTGTTGAGAGATGAEASPAVGCAQPVGQPVRGTPTALVATKDANGCAGYLIVTQSGDVSGFGGAVNYGSLLHRHLTSPVVAVAPGPDDNGYWMLTANGTVYGFGDAKLYGSANNLPLTATAVGMAATPDARGYWVVTSDGGVYAYGDARFYGSLSDKQLNRPIVGMAATPTGDGYWLVASDGGVFGFGGAKYDGSTGGTHASSPVVGIAAGPAGVGYRIVAANGSTSAFGTTLYGRAAAGRLPHPVAGIALSTDGKGYYLMDTAGQIYTYGDAVYLGDATH